MAKYRYGLYENFFGDQWYQVCMTPNYCKPLLPCLSDNLLISTNL